jgi:hypothetical protein
VEPEVEDQPEGEKKKGIDLSDLIKATQTEFHLELIRKLPQPSSSKSPQPPDVAMRQSWRPFSRSAPTAFGTA